MLQLLIVDDEQHAVEGIRSGVNWGNLGIAEIFTAMTVRQAKEMFEQEHIDIMLCDIEMPQATGLELAEWVRERFPRTETIFLTCHADFRYAKQALQLGSFDYMLKPVPFAELELVIRKAAEKIRKDTEQAEFTQYGQYWFQHQPLLIERFWLDILNQNVPATMAAVQRAAAERNIPYNAGMTFIPVLINIQRWHKPLSLRDEKIMEYALKKSAAEMLIESGGAGQVLSMEGGRILAIISADGTPGMIGSLQEGCEKFIEACQGYFYCDLSCYLGEAVHGHEMFAMVNRLKENDSNNVAYTNRVFLLSGVPGKAIPSSVPDMGVWAAMLQDGKYTEVMAEADGFLDKLMKQDLLDASFLRQFYQDFQQTLYYALQNKGIQAHSLFSDPASMQFAAGASRSITGFREWMRHAVGKAMDYAQSIAQSRSVVERVMDFIKLHMAEDLSREDIANHVFLNPDYLTRIFKKETGMAVSDYLLHERLKLAQELLAKTDMPISSVASHIGYSNFSHFSRMFKKHTTLNPNEYRQLQQQGQTNN